jgi:hypothetical protein
MTAKEVQGTIFDYASATGKAAALCAVIASIIDMAKRVHDYTVPALVVGLVLLGAALVANMLVQGYKDQIRALIIFGLLLASSSVVIMVAQGSSPEAQERGYLAAHVPGMSDIQARLFDIQQSNRQIATNTQTIATNTGTIAAEIPAVKQETSVDPRKELQNLGIPWTSEGFFRAVNTKDEHVVELYVRAGFKLDLADLEKFTGSAANFDSDMAERIVSNNMVSSSVACPTPELPDMNRLLEEGDNVSIATALGNLPDRATLYTNARATSPDAARLIRSVCGRSSVVEKIDAAVAEMNQQNEAARRSMDESCNQLRGLTDRAALNRIVAQCTAAQVMVASLPPAITAWSNASSILK